MKPLKKTFRLFSVIPALSMLAALISCAANDGGALGGGGVGGTLENALQGGGVGGGQASGKGGGGGGGGDEGEGDSSGDGSENQGGGGWTNYFPLDAGVLAPDQMHPHKPANAVIGKIEVLCRLPEGRARLQVTGHVQYLGYDSLQKAQRYFDFEPTGKLRIIDHADDQFIDVNLTPYEAQVESSNPIMINLNTRRNQFQVSFVTQLPYSEDQVIRLGLVYYPTDQVKDKNGEEQSCPTMKYSDSANEPPTPVKNCYSPNGIVMEKGNLFGLYKNSKDLQDFESDPSKIPMCQIAVPAAVQQQGILN